MMQDQIANVLWNRPIGPAHYRIGLACGPEMADAVPGQFVMVQLLPCSPVLLRRPFSICKPIEENGAIIGIELIYKVVGQGTRAMAVLKPGAKLKLLGPLGNGFKFPIQAKNHLLVAGGIGVAPLVFLAWSMAKNGVSGKCCQVYIGGQTEEELFCRDDFAGLGYRCRVGTDDGSAGDQCLITDPVADAVTETCPDMIYACGPLPMITCLMGIAEKAQSPCQVALETVMACGMGVCLGCAVKPKKASTSYLHACTDGPVFDAAVVDLAALTS